MNLVMFKSKIHRATVTGCDLSYEGSITIDALLLEKSGILPYEQVDVLNINNGHRFTTYAIEGIRGSGEIKVNGAAARLAQRGDIIIICAYTQMTAAEAERWKPTVVQVDAYNSPLSSTKATIKKIAEMA